MTARFEALPEVVALEVDRHVAEVAGRRHERLRAPSLVGLCCRVIDLEDARRRQLRKTIGPAVEARAEEDDLPHPSRDGFPQRRVDEERSQRDEVGPAPDGRPHGGAALREPKPERPCGREERGGRGIGEVRKGGHACVGEGAQKGDQGRGLAWTIPHGALFGSGTLPLRQDRSRARTWSGKIRAAPPGPFGQDEASTNAAVSADFLSQESDPRPLM
ncbi:MAG TPA: hypothetical protein VGI39_45630 [Polyangiaceae bacterium]